MAVVETLLMIRNFVTLPTPINGIISAAQAVLVVAVLGTWLWLRSRDLTSRAVGVVVFATLLWLSGLILLEQALTHQGLLSANLALSLVVGGALIWPGRRFIAYSALLVAGWLGVILTHADWDIPVMQQALLIFLGVFIGAVVAILRDFDRRQLEVARDEAVQSALRDPLTQLWNRRGVRAVLPSMIGGAHTLHATIWCVFIDVRGLKAVNDSLGHAAGDDLLTAIGSVLVEQEKQGRVPARWGGDEFCLFGGGPAPSAEQLADDLRRRIMTRTTLSASWDLTCGVAIEDVRGEDIEDLVERADEDMYRRRADQTP